MPIVGQSGYSRQADLYLYQPLSSNSQLNLKFDQVKYKNQSLINFC